MTGVKVGDKLMVFDINGSRMGQPPGGWPGVVIKVGRKYFVVEYSGHRATTFLLEDGRENDSSRHRYVKTPEQAELERRHHQASQELRERKITLDLGHDFTLEQIEQLAALVRTF